MEDGHQWRIWHNSEADVKKHESKGHKESDWIFTVLPNLIGLFQQPVEPGHLRFQLPDQLPTVVLIDRGAVHDVFSSASVTQGAQSLAVVHRGRRNGCESAQLYALVWKQGF